MGCHEGYNGVVFVPSFHYVDPMGKKTRAKKKRPDAAEVVEEKRKAPRVHVGAELSAYFRVVSGDGNKKSKEVSASVENLSEIGCCLATDLIMVDALHVLSSSTGTAGNTLAIRIPLTAEREVRILGVTSWYDTADAQSRQRYKVGVKVTHISEDDLQTMRQCLRLSFREKLKVLGAKWIGRLRGSGEP